MSKRSTISIMAFLAVFILSWTLTGCTQSGQNDGPVVKPSDKTQSEDSEGEFVITPHDSDAIMQNMPVHDTVEKLAADQSAIGGVSPITVHQSFSFLLKTFETHSEFKKDYDKAESWNKVFEYEQKNNASFYIDKSKSFKYVIILDKRTIIANEIGEKYFDQLNELDANEMILFLSLENSNPVKVDYSGSYIGLKIPDSNPHAVEKAASFLGLMYKHGDIFVLRGSSATPEERFQQGMIIKGNQESGSGK